MDKDTIRVGSCEVGVVEELPAGVSTIGINNDHLPQEVKLDFVHILQSLTPVGG